MIVENNAVSSSPKLEPDRSRSVTGEQAIGPTHHLVQLATADPAHDTLRCGRPKPHGPFAIG